MAKLEHIGIAPNLLLRDVEVTAPFVFRGELNTSGTGRAYLAKLIHHKKNLSQLKNMDLAEYFYLCMAAHWTTAGTFVPTNVDNQIREGLWKHPEIQRYLKRMGEITLESWNWDYSQVTNRKAFNPTNGQVMSTHEGTWLSVAIGAYCALKKHRHPLHEDLAQSILQEIDKEEKLLLELRDRRDGVNFLRSSALMAHNFGDLDRVIDQWQMPEDEPFRQRIYKLGHEPHPAQSPVLAFAGQVNKKFLSVENHRHMSMRQPKCLRRSHKFLIPVGPFMDTWGKTLGESNELSSEEKGEIVTALFEGYNRQNLAMGYVRAFSGLLVALPRGLESLERDLPFDLVQELKRSRFYAEAQQSEAEFTQEFLKQFYTFTCPLTGLSF